MLELFQTFALPVLAIMIVSYLLGSISFSIIFTKMFSKEDIRTMGSGNAGTTNVLRSVGKRAAILTFVFDILKCVISVLLAKYILEYICFQYMHEKYQIFVILLFYQTLFFQ